MKFWSELPQNDKISVLLGLLGVSAFTIIILYAFLVSRGNDVDYFKSRIDMVDQRTLYMDSKIDKMSEKIADYRSQLNELRRKEDEIEKRLDAYGHWIEYWKTLPQLPKPPKR